MLKKFFFCCPAPSKGLFGALLLALGLFGRAFVSSCIIRPIFRGFCSTTMATSSELPSSIAMDDSKWERLSVRVKSLESSVPADVLKRLTKFSSDQQTTQAVDEQVFQLNTLVVDLLIANQKLEQDVTNCQAEVKNAHVTARRDRNLLRVDMEKEMIKLMGQAEQASSTIKQSQLTIQDLQQRLVGVTPSQPAGVTATAASSVIFSSASSLEQLAREADLLRERIRHDDALLDQTKRELDIVRRARDDSSAQLKLYVDRYGPLPTTAAAASASTTAAVYQLGAFVTAPPAPVTMSPQSPPLAAITQPPLFPTDSRAASSSPLLLPTPFGGINVDPNSMASPVPLAALSYGPLIRTTPPPPHQIAFRLLPSSVQHHALYSASSSQSLHSSISSGPTTHDTLSSRTLPPTPSSLVPSPRSSALETKSPTPAAAAATPHAKKYSCVYGYCAACAKAVAVKVTRRCSKCKSEDITDAKEQHWADLNGQYLGCVHTLPTKCDHKQWEFIGICPQHPDDAPDKHCPLLPGVVPNTTKAACDACNRVEDMILRFGCGHFICIPKCWRNYARTKLDNRELLFDTPFQGNFLPRGGHCVAPTPPSLFFFCWG